MHEMSLALNIVDIVTEEVRKNDGTRVIEIQLEVGACSGVDPEALSFALTMAGKDTVLESARIDLLNPPGDELRIVSLTIDEPHTDSSQ